MRQLEIQLNLATDKLLVTKPVRKCDLGSFHTTSEKFQNAAISVRFELPSSLICHEKGAFPETLFEPEEFENAGFSFSC